MINLNEAANTLNNPHLDIVEVRQLPEGQGDVEWLVLLDLHCRVVHLQLHRFLSNFLVFSLPFQRVLSGFDSRIFAMDD